MDQATGRKRSLALPHPTAAAEACLPHPHRHRPAERRQRLTDHQAAHQRQAAGQSVHVPVVADDRLSGGRQRDDVAGAGALNEAVDDGYLLTAPSFSCYPGPRRKPCA